MHPAPRRLQRAGAARRRRDRRRQLTSERGSGPGDDPVIRQLREQLSDTDRAIVDGINRRLQLVARLKRYKESRGLAFVDPDREEWMLSYLARANRGPLTPDGLREIYAELLALTKREVGRGEAD